VTIFYANCDTQTNFRRRVVGRRMQRNYKFEKEPQQVKVLKGEGFGDGNFGRERPQPFSWLQNITSAFDQTEQWEHIDYSSAIKGYSMLAARCSRTQAWERRPDCIKNISTRRRVTVSSHCRCFMKRKGARNLGKPNLYATFGRSVSKPELCGRGFGDSYAAIA
jgi:hypothetical protein